MIGIPGQMARGVASGDPDRRRGNSRRRKELLVVDGEGRVDRGAEGRAVFLLQARRARTAPPIPRCGSVPPPIWNGVGDHFFRLGNIEAEACLADAIFCREVGEMLEKIGWQVGVEFQIGVRQAKMFWELIVESCVAKQVPRAPVFLQAKDAQFSFQRIQIFKEGRILGPVINHDDVRQSNAAQLLDHPSQIGRIVEDRYQNGDVPERIPGVGE